MSEQKRDTVIQLEAARRRKAAEAVRKAGTRQGYKGYRERAVNWKAAPRAAVIFILFALIMWAAQWLMNKMTFAP